MKILITGAAGFIGFHLADYLSNKEHEVILVDNFDRSKDDDDFSSLLKKSNVTFYELDVTEPNCFDELEEDIKAVYHLAAINGTENFYKIPDKVLKVNVMGTLNLLEWVKEKADIKILYSSSSEVYAGSLQFGIGSIPTDEKVPICIDDITNVRWSYGISKALAEGALFAYSSSYNLRFSCIRYHNIYGPRMGKDHVIPQFYDRITGGEIPLKVYGTEQTRSFCFVSDAVRATELVMETSNLDNHIVHIGNDEEEIQIADLARMMLEINSSPTKIISCEAPKGSVERRCPDLSLLRSYGYSPTVPLNEGVKKTISWYQENFK